MEKQTPATTKTAGEIGKLLQRHFCKGPRSTNVVLAPPYLVIYVREFLAPMEQVLLDQHQPDAVHRCRSMIFDHVGAPLQDTVQTHLAFAPTEMHVDWNFSQASCMILLVGEALDPYAPSFQPMTASQAEDFSPSAGLHPSMGAWESWGWMNDHLFLAQRKNVITPFEEAMIAEHDPRFVERHRAEADKRGVHGDRLAQAFHKPLQDVFVTGRLAAEHSYTLLCFDSSYEYS